MIPAKSKAFPLIPKCSTHPEKSYCLYCQDCKSLTCEICGLLKHKGHDFLTIEEGAGKERKQLEDGILPKIKEKEISLNKILAQLGSQREELRNALTKIDLDIQERIEIHQQIVETSKAISNVIQKPSDVMVLTQSKQIRDEVNTLRSSLNLKFGHVAEINKLDLVFSIAGCTIIANGRGVVSTKRSGYVPAVLGPALPLDRPSFWTITVNQNNEGGGWLFLGIVLESSTKGKDFAQSHPFHHCFNWPGCYGWQGVGYTFVSGVGVAVDDCDESGFKTGDRITLCYSPQDHILSIFPQSILNGVAQVTISELPEPEHIKLLKEK